MKLKQCLMKPCGKRLLFSRVRVLVHGLIPAERSQRVTPYSPVFTEAAFTLQPAVTRSDKPCRSHGIHPFDARETIRLLDWEGSPAF